MCYDLWGMSHGPPYWSTTHHTVPSRDAPNYRSRTLTAVDKHTSSLTGPVMYALIHERAYHTALEFVCP